MHFLYTLAALNARGHFYSVLLDSAILQFRGLIMLSRLRHHWRVTAFSGATILAVALITILVFASDVFSAPVKPVLVVRLRPCDIYSSGGTPCVAAHSTVRALYGNYIGNLYQVRRASDDTTQDIGVLSPGGYANAAIQDAFCAGT
ncbi:MAG TPA: arabinofuranosidase catalytic domain-containing protein, partial [Ktedonobacterales bacterium]|nr:arabinofuranosidase catalytic domain-containing protein [Ktedonobacterales bacterium]